MLKYRNRFHLLKGYITPHWTPAVSDIGTAVHEAAEAGSKALFKHNMDGVMMIRLQEILI
jgi:hypothetical protein